MSISFSAFKQRVVKRPDSPSAVLNVTDLPTTCVLRGALARASTVSFNRLVRGPVITALRTLRRGEELPPELSELRRHFERGLTYKNAAKVSALGLYLIARGDRNRFSRCLAVAGLINGLNSQHSADFSAAALVALAFGQEDPWVISQVESRLLNPRKPQGSAALALQLAKYVHRTAEQGRESKLAARLLEAVLEICEENTASGLYCVGYLPAVAIAHCMPRYSEASTRVLFKSLGERDTAYHAAAAIFRLDVSRQASEGEAAQLICASLRELNRINKLEVLAACSENIDRPIARLVSERQKVNFVELFSVPEAIPSVCKIIDALSDSSLQDGDLIEVVNRALVRVESIARLVHCLPQLSCADPDTLSRYVADTALEKVLRYYHFLEPTSYINTLNVSLDIFTEASETLTACTQIFLDRKKYDRASQYLNPTERLLEYWGLELSLIHI